ncbi:MAG: RNB domain-containing ribonuclease [Nitrospiraceae bacterium]
MANNRKDLREIARRAMIERDLLPDFSDAAIFELGRIRGAATSDEPNIRDVRGLLWASIDNDDSRDLDQLTVADPLPNGSVRVLVAIADVDSLVEKDSALDAHAKHNTTSVYTAGEIFPMLPDELSTDLTSLNETQDRLAIVVEMLIAADGRVMDSSLFRALVRNHAKLAYNGVAAWLDESAPVPARIENQPGLQEQLRLQDRVAQTLKTRRHQQGALSLTTIEARAVFDGDILTGLDADPKNRAKELIEDFMIAANQATVSYLKRKGVPSLRRILRSPERWERIMQVAARTGDQLPPEPDPRALQAFLVKRKQADPVRFPDLSLAVVKLIGRGEYALDESKHSSPDHFGLAVKGYTHSTAPNRRFPDLITQRLVKATLAGVALPYNPDELCYLADHCTDKEDDAEKVERQVRKSAAALLLESHIGQRFDAIVTGAADKGTWVRIFQPPVEGKLVTGASGLDVGDRVRVELVSTDVERGHIDFLRVGS